MQGRLHIIVCFVAYDNFLSFGVGQDQFRFLKCMLLCFMVDLGLRKIYIELNWVYLFR